MDNVCDTVGVFFFKQKTAYEMRISDWSSDVCSSDLRGQGRREIARDVGRIGQPEVLIRLQPSEAVANHDPPPHIAGDIGAGAVRGRAQKADCGARLAFSEIGRAHV